MSRCIRCGMGETEERRYVCVTTETETKKNPAGRGKTQVTRETVSRIIPAAVCPACARKQKVKAVLKTIPITLAVTPILVLLSLFAVRPNRNIRAEVASLSTTLPVVAGIVWICGLFVYLPIPRDKYMTDIIRSHLGLPPQQFLVPLDRRSLTRKDRPVKRTDVTRRCPVKTDLADELVPLINNPANPERIQALVGRTFMDERPAR